MGAKSGKRRKPGNAPPGRWPRRVLAVRVLAARLAWLDGKLYWRGDRIVWEGPDGGVTPGPAHLSRAQRALNKIRGFPVSAALTLGDAEAWLADRQARLELAKRLAALGADDLTALAGRARGRDPGAARALAALLPAEALCLNPLPASPSAALLVCSEQGEPLLRGVLEDGEWPPPVRVLAALALGALHRGRAEAGAFPGDPRLRRAYAFGRRAGLTAAPALVAALLANEEGASLVGRCLQALEGEGPCRLAAEDVRELLAEGASPAAAVALAEACAEADSLERHFSRRREALPVKPVRERRERAERFQRERVESLAAMRGVLHRAARATHDPEVVRLGTALLDYLQSACVPAPEVVREALGPVEAALNLPSGLARPFLELLNEYRERFWDLNGAERLVEGRVAAPWIRHGWEAHGARVRRLLRFTRDGDMVRETISLGLCVPFSQADWPDVEACRFVLRVARTVPLFGRPYLVGSLCDAQAAFVEPRAGRAALKPLLDLVVDLPEAERGHYLKEFLEAGGAWRGSARSDLPILAAAAPRLIRPHDTESDAFCFCSALGEAAVLLYRQVPDAAEARLEWLTEYAAQLEVNEGLSWAHASGMRSGVLLGVAVAGEDTARFQAVVRTAVARPDPQGRDLPEAGVEALRALPALHEAIGHLFPRQPERCSRFLTRLGLTARFDEAIRAPLQALRDLAGASAPVAAEGWGPVLDLLPEAREEAAAFTAARGMVGESVAPPPGILRALELPRRLERERRFLEEKAAREPGNPGLLARAASLRERLTDEERLRTAMREEVRERLREAAAAAVMAAAERQVLACYRVRLEQAAGPVPPAIRLDDDLLNAALLIGDIERNRRLLRRLLRAHLSGDHGWRERHPANAAFLRRLAESGVDANAWLRAHPRRYACPSAAGGRVHLRLERDPLRTLQMGNYFDTCLSFGGGNAFSTVANACELNKRVVYARDAAGRVVGRKLIGLNEEGSLIGFHTYTSLPDDAGNTALREVFRRYLADFAARCRLSLSDTGTVPRLFAEDWYYDGVVPWNADASDRRGKSGAGGATNT